MRSEAKRHLPRQKTRIFKRFFAMSHISVQEYYTPYLVWLSIENGHILCFWRFEQKKSAFSTYGRKTNGAREKRPGKIDMFFCGAILPERSLCLLRIKGKHRKNKGFFATCFLLVFCLFSNSALWLYRKFRLWKNIKKKFLSSAISVYIHNL